MLPTETLSGMTKEELVEYMGYVTEYVDALEDAAGAEHNARAAERTARDAVEKVTEARVTAARMMDLLIVAERDIMRQCGERETNVSAE